MIVSSQQKVRWYAEPKSTAMLLIAGSSSSGVKDVQGRHSYFLILPEDFDPVPCRAVRRQAVTSQTVLLQQCPRRFPGCRRMARGRVQESTTIGWLTRALRVMSQPKNHQPFTRCHRFARTAWVLPTVVPAERCGSCGANLASSTEATARSPAGAGGRNAAIATRARSNRSGSRVVSSYSGSAAIPSPVVATPDATWSG